MPRKNIWTSYRGVVGQWFLLAVVLLLHGSAWARQSDDPADFLTVWSGMLPIILAAPHGGRVALPGVPQRRGDGVAQFTAERDNNTAELAEAVAVKIEEALGAKPFLIIAHFERKYLDANRPESEAFEASAVKPYYDAYHRAIETATAKIRSRWGQGLLLDIHGQGAEPDAIFRGTDNGKSVSALLQRHGKAALTGPQSILGRLALKGYKIFPDSAGDDRERRYTGGYTTRTYGSHRGTHIDAIQLELGGNLRSRRNLQRTANDLTEAIANFARAFLRSSEMPANP
jgi:N-formylglutamate amidohydrolase